MGGMLVNDQQLILVFDEPEGAEYLPNQAETNRVFFLKQLLLK